MDSAAEVVDSATTGEAVDSAPPEEFIDMLLVCLVVRIFGWVQECVSRRGFIHVMAGHRGVRIGYSRLPTPMVILAIIEQLREPMMAVACSKLFMRTAQSLGS